MIQHPLKMRSKNCLVIICIFILFSCKKEKIRKTCNEIHSVSYRNIISIDGLDTIPEDGEFKFGLYKDSLCQYIGELDNINKIENVNTKKSMGFIEFYFKDKDKNYIGTIILRYIKDSGYYITLGGHSYYGHARLPYFLLDKVRVESKKNKH